MRRMLRPDKPDWWSLAGKARACWADKSRQSMFAGGGSGCGPGDGPGDGSGDGPDSGRAVDSKNAAKRIKSRRYASTVCADSRRWRKWARKSPNAWMCGGVFVGAGDGGDDDDGADDG